MLSDEEILERGGDQEDINAYAHDVGGACGKAYDGQCDRCDREGSMKDTETVTLDDILFAQYQLGRAHQRISMVEKRKVGGEITEAKAAIIKLFEQTVESAKPALKPRFGPMNENGDYAPEEYENGGYNNGVAEYQQNLLQALSNSG